MIKCGRRVVPDTKKFFFLPLLFWEIWCREEKGNAEMPTTQDAVHTIVFQSAPIFVLLLRRSRDLLRLPATEEEKTSRAKFAVWEMEASDRKRKISKKPIFFVLRKPKFCLCCVHFFNYVGGKKVSFLAEKPSKDFFPILNEGKRSFFSQEMEGNRGANKFISLVGVCQKISLFFRMPKNRQRVFSQLMKGGEEEMPLIDPAFFLSCNQGNRSE